MSSRIGVGTLKSIGLRWKGRITTVSDLAFLYPWIILLILLK